MKHPHAGAGPGMSFPTRVVRGVAGSPRAGKGRPATFVEPGRPVKARPAALHGGLSTRDALHAVMLATLAHLRANEPGVLGGRNPEYLHQMRVALRRLRSVVEIFGPLLPKPAVARALGGIKWLAASLGPAREWDVFVYETLPAVGREHRARGGMTEFNARCAELRSRANARARRTVRSLRYQRFKRSLASLDESGDRPARLEDTSARAVLLGPVGEFASAVLERRYGQVRRKGRGLGGASSSERHRLRIAIKKFRYATDFFSGLYDTQRARHALRRLGRLQDILGAINDAAAIAELMAQAFGGAHGRRVVDARGIVLGWGSGRAAALKHELMGAWKEFRTVEKFW